MGAANRAKNTPNGNDVRRTRTKDNSIVFFAKLSPQQQHLSSSPQSLQKVVEQKEHIASRPLHRTCALVSFSL